MNKGHVILLIILVVVFLVAISLAFPEIFSQQGIKKIKVSSTAFSQGERIPDMYSREGGDISPPISWEKVEGATCYALVMYDPDAPGGTFYHWILVNIPSNVTSIPQGVPKTPKIEGLGVQCINDYGYTGYGGPMPPPGETHRYVFRVYALDSWINVEGSCNRDIINAIEEHAIAYGELEGVYGG